VGKGCAFAWGVHWPWKSVTSSRLYPCTPGVSAIMLNATSILLPYYSSPSIQTSNKLFHVSLSPWARLKLRFLLLRLGKRHGSKLLLKLLDLCINSPILSSCNLHVSQVFAKILSVIVLTPSHLILSNSGWFSTNLSICFILWSVFFSHSHFTEEVSSQILYLAGGWL